MPKNPFRIRVFFALFFGLLLFLPQQGRADGAYPYGWSPQNGLLGLNEDLWKSAKYGAGVTFAVIDTGVAAPWIGFQSRVDTANATCTIAGCAQSLAYTDDNGHGTFVASMIAGDLRGSGFTGIAPAARILPVKVLDANGSGYASDVAAGITYAVNKGAQVLNLSMTFIPTAEIVSAINYAASKNAVIVFAGGNSAQAFLNNARISGFTDAAIQRMIFMGSTNLQQQLSSFSNTPGTGGFVSTSNKFYSFSSRWMMADGESIWGASTYHPAGAYSYVTQMSGTSMAAPEGAAAAGLLAARWSFLLKAGTIPEILFVTAQDLGSAGIDSTYGTGFLRIDRAFMPIGTLTVPVNKKNVPATGAVLIPGGAFGSVPGISSAFSKTVGYDNYRRDFQIYVPNSILTPSKTKTSSAAARVQGQSGPGTRSLVDLGDGAWLAAALADSAPYSSPILPDGRMNMGLIQDPTRPVAAEWSLAFQQRDGGYLGMGQGANAALLFNDARWGGRSAFFNSDQAVGGSLLGLSSAGASFAAMGLDLDSRSRVAVGFMDSENGDLRSLSGGHPASQGAALSYTLRPSQGLALSFSSAFLRENNMLLGSAGSSYLSFGQASTVSLGLGASLDLGHGYTLGADTVAATTSGTRNANSLITGTSRLTSAGVSMVLNKANLTGHADDVSFSVKKPLRVYSGTASVTAPVGTDDDGNPVIQSSRVSLTPSGNETDFGVDYRRPLAPGAETSFSLSYRLDADNVAGARDAAAMVRYKASF